MEEISVQNEKIVNEEDKKRANFQRAFDRVQQRNANQLQEKTKPEADLFDDDSLL